MLRFISLRGQTTALEPRFAFYDTSIGRFLEFDGDQAWRTGEEFLAAFSASHGRFADQTYCINRLTSLLPEWARDERSMRITS